MSKKLLLIVAVLCLLVPFLVLGTISANAEQLTFTDNSNNTRYLNVGRFEYQQSPLSYSWAGSPQFALTMSTLTPSFYSYGASYGIRQLDFSIKGFDLSINNAFQFATTDGVSSTIRFNVQDDFQHSIFILVNYVSGVTNGVVDDTGLNARNRAYNGESHLYLNYATSLNFFQYNMYVGNYQWSPDNTYSLSFGNTAYSNSSFAPDFLLSALDLTTGASQSNVEQVNNFMVYAFSVGRGSYIISSTSFTPDNMYMLCILDYWTTGNGYQSGYDAGYTSANNTIRPGSPNYVAGQDNANSTVNQNSASYIAGFNAGVEQDNPYTFGKLITAVIDVPIMALFGHVDANGVEQPGLFNFEFLGVNMASFVLSIFTLCVVVTILRLVLGGK